MGSKHSINYKVPREFINNSGQVINRNDVMYLINNCGNMIHSHLFEKYRDVCCKYFWITIEDNNVHHNIEFTCDQRYVFIKVMLMDHNHVNCIIIDNIKGTIVYFEPRCCEIIDRNMIKSILSYPDYEWYFSEDLGFGLFNRIQYFDNMCQTYILMGFLVIINNPSVEIVDYADMLNGSLKSDNYRDGFYRNIIKNTDITYLLQYRNYKIDNISTVHVNFDSDL